jgi:uncharacterized membrane-anchored protein YitT (DUF2179 family)
MPLLRRIRPGELKEYSMLTLGTLLIAVGVYFFKFPNRFSTGGVSGVSVILGHYLPSITPGALVFIINQALLLLGFAVFGRSFGIRTAYGSLLMSGLVWLFETVFPMSQPMTGQPLLELIFSVTLPAVGSAILFNLQSSSGGTDIVAMILRKKTSVNIGNALLCVDFLITVAACFAFGMETGLFSVLGLLVKALLVDMVLENIKIHKCFQIITTTPAPIVDYIVARLGRGATTLSGKGAFTHENKEIILTVVSRSQAVKLRAFAKEIDPYCFILITNTGEIIGKGFRGAM